MFILIWLLCAVPLFAQPAPAKVQVAEITLIGNQLTRPWVIERELRFDVEDSVTAADLEAARLRLLSLGLFNNVRVDHDNEGVITVQVSEQFRFIPILGASPMEGSLNDALREPDRIMDIIVFTAGFADINFRGHGAALGVLTEFGARSGVNLEYQTRWLSPRRPLAVSVGVRSLDLSDRHASVLGFDRRLKQRRAFIDVATRRGAPSRLGLNLRYDHVSESAERPATGDTHQALWFAPYAILDRRNLEWYPTHGLFARADLESAFGTTTFLRSRATLATYAPLTDGSRPLLIAARCYGGTAQSNTPPWARYYFGFADNFRGYSSVKSEAANYLSGEVEVRFPVTREITYDVPLVGRYGQDIPFWIGGAVFAERAHTQLDGARTDLFAYGAALHVRFPYVQVFEISYARNLDNESEVVFATGVRF